MTLIGEVNEYVRIDDLVEDSHYQYVVVDENGDTLEVLPGTIEANGIRYVKLKNGEGIRLEGTRLVMALIKRRIYTVYEL